MTTRESDKARAAEGGEQGRAITRGEEAGDECIGCSHSRGSHDRSDGSCIYCNCPAFRTATAEKPHAYRVGCAACKAGASHVEEPKAPPSWLTAAVLAALPCDGQPVERNGAFHKAIDAAAFKAGEEWTLGSLDAALDAMTGAGEIEYMGGGQWRRWGVPEGFDWVGTEDVRSNLVGTIDGTTLVVATAFPNGGWRAGTSSRHNVATPPTLAAARTAALRACWERGVFGPRPAPTLITSTPQSAAPTRAEAIRAALLAVLSRGPVATRGTLLPAVETEMGAAPGSVEPAEARQAAREIGAVVDGARWALVEGPPPGWGWRLSRVPHCWFLTRLDTADVEGGAVAIIQRDSVADVLGWKLLPDGEQWWAPSIEEGQAAALAAARRAGLFARPAAVEVTGDGGPAVVPAVTSQGGEAVVVEPCRHGPTCDLARSILTDRDTSRIEAKLMAWRADILAEARAVELGVAIEAVGEQGGAVMAAIPHATVQASLAARAYAADAPLLYAVWKAAQRVREATACAGDDLLDEAVGSLVAVLDAAEREGTQPRPAPFDGFPLAARVRLDALSADIIEARNGREAAEREAAEARTSIGVAIRQRDAAERERDEARSELARVRQGILDVMAKGVAS